jgi:tetratricopeptide (TPR) repeat protein
MYIDFLMEHGIIAALAIVALGILLYKPLITVLTNDAHYFAPLAIIVGYLAQGLFYFPTMLTTVLFVFSLGFMVAKLLPNTVALNLPTTSEKSVILLLVILLLAWLIPLTKADYTLSLYGQSPLPFSAEDMRKNLGLPISNNILKRYFAYFHPRETEGIEILATLASSNDMDDLRVAGDVYYVLAKDSNTLAEVNSSIAALEKLTQIDPTVPSNWDMLGLRYLFIRNYDKATSSFEKAISLKEDYWYSYLHIGETLRQQCSPEKAIEWYKKAEQYVPSAQTEIEEAKQEIITPRKECL